MKHTDPRHEQTDARSRRRRASDDRRSRRAAEPDTTVALHRAVGNQAIKDAQQPADTPANLELSHPAETSEREAEAVAEAVMRLSESEPPDRERLAAQSTPELSGSKTGGSEMLTRSLTGGRPLSRSVRADMEPVFGRDFGDVRIHTGPDADRVARSIDAAAFTEGTDIAFASGSYRPESPGGRRLIAHELTHVSQQTDAGKAGPATIQRQSEPSEKQNGEPQALVERHTDQTTGGLDEAGLAGVLLDQYLLQGKHDIVGDVFGYLRSSPASVVEGDANQVARSIYDQATDAEVETIVQSTSPRVRRYLNEAQTAGGETSFYPTQTDDRERSRDRATLQSMQGVVEYQVQEGDTLSALAGEYDVPGGWNTIWETNRSVIGDDPDVIYPDQTLYIPQTEQAVARLQDESQHERMEQLRALTGSE
jgi:LysM repeat protein